MQQPEPVKVDKLLCRVAACLFVAVVLSACANSTSEVSQEVNEALQGALPDIPTSSSIVAEQISWLDTFQEPILISLVNEALDNNRNLQAAAANVDRARALAVQAGAGLIPAINLAAGTDRSGLRAASTDISENLNTNIQLNWEIDVWGRVRSGSQAAVASTEAAEADFLFTRYSIAASTIRAYLIAVEAVLQIDVTREILASLEETLRIVELRYDNGLASSLDLSLTRSDMALAREQLAAAEAGQREALRALEVLLGRYPSAEVDVDSELPEIAAIPMTNVSSELLERRPDLVAAERRVASAFNALNQAEAARLPRISLTSAIGGSSNALSTLLDGGNVAWQAGTSLLSPLIDGGLNRAQVEAASADQEQAIAAYAQAALDAFNEVETLLDQGVVLQQRLAEIKKAATQTAEAYRVADLRYREGETDILDVLTIQNRVTSTRSSLVSLQRAQLDNRVNLFLALGGSWQ
jgi:NodT family efflux transporter outer membrane factor (OMF) lipoprotein